VEKSQAKASDIIEKAKYIEQAAFVKSKGILKKADCDTSYIVRGISRRRGYLSL
jgi:hypothetical protein